MAQKAQRKPDNLYMSVSQQPAKKSTAAATSIVPEHDARNAESAHHVRTWIAELSYFTRKALQLHYTDESIFSVPTNSIIIHACNTRGWWGKGVALELRREYPTHYLNYKDFCSEKASREILGTSLLIAPFGMRQSSPNHNAQVARHKHWIACLFVSEDIGRDALTQWHRQQGVLQCTRTAMLNLINHINHACSIGSKPGELHMPQINSGSFQIPWHRTVKVLEDVSEAQTCFSGGLRIHVHRSGL